MLVEKKSVHQRKRLSVGTRLSGRDSARRPKKNGLRMVGPKVVEPHKDGCPHWHLVVWTDDQKLAEGLLNTYFLDADDPYEPGAAEHRITWEQARSNTGAIAYILKYALKYSLESNAGPESRARLAVNAWRSLYGLRKLDWFSVNVAQPKVGVWREARRASQSTTAMKDAIDAAKNGDWYAFTKACLSNPLWLSSEWVTNKHGEVTSRTIGIRDDRGSLIVTRSHRWKITTLEELSKVQSLREEFGDIPTEKFARPPTVSSRCGGLGTLSHNHMVTDNHNMPRRCTACSSPPRTVSATCGEKSSGSSARTSARAAGVRSMRASISDSAEEP